MEHIVEEALRYMGVRHADTETRNWLTSLADEAAGKADAHWVLRESPLAQETGGIRLTRFDLLLTGQTARTMLADCESAVLFVCTLGLGYERYCRSAQATDMRRAVGLDALGSALVEAACDQAEADIRQRHPGLYLTDRFSPGYGDLPLRLQPALLTICDAQRRIGVTLTESLLMLPQKSVSAIVGLSRHPQRARVRGCTYCSFAQNCSIRQQGGCSIS